jgi:hypothetical protein
MKTRNSIALAMALLLSGVTAASAADMGASSSHSTMGQKASDSLNLDTVQQKAAYRDLSNVPNAKQNPPSGFNAIVGAVVPNTLKIQPVTQTAWNAVPSLQPYDFAIVQGKLLIVNPSDKKIAEVITG